MQIEQSFRDLKSHRWGWSLRHCNSRSAQRIEILLLIAAIAALLQQLVGMAGERRSMQRRYQANTVRTRRILSHFMLGALLLADDELREVPNAAILKTLRDVRKILGQLALPPP
jgi:hypothetical protein